MGVIPSRQLANGACLDLLSAEDKLREAPQAAAHRLGSVLRRDQVDSAECAKCSASSCVFFLSFHSVSTTLTCHIYKWTLRSFSPSFSPVLREIEGNLLDGPASDGRAGQHLAQADQSDRMDGVEKHRHREHAAGLRRDCERSSG